MDSGNLYLLRQPVSRTLALNGAEPILAVYATPIGDPWENFLSTRALGNGVYFAACNYVGNEGEWDM